MAEKYARLVQNMYESSKTVHMVDCKNNKWLQSGGRTASRIGPEPILVAMVMDRLMDGVRQQSPWTMIFADDIVFYSESREQFEEDLERLRYVLEKRAMKVSHSMIEYVCE